MLRCASRVPNITKAVEVRFGSVMMLSTLVAQQETIQQIWKRQEVWLLWHLEGRVGDLEVVPGFAFIPGKNHLAKGARWLPKRDPGSEIRSMTQVRCNGMQWICSSALQSTCQCQLYVCHIQTLSVVYLDVDSIWMLTF